MRNSIHFSINHSHKIIDIASIELYDTNSESIRFRDELAEVSQNTLQEIILNLSSEFNDYYFYWIEHGECILKKWDETEIHLLIKIFNNNKIYDKLFFVDNNCGESPYKNILNHKVVPFMLGFTADKSFKISERKFEKKFISLNSLPKPHRRDIFKFLRDDYINESYLSFAPNYMDDEDRMVLDDISITEDGKIDSAWTTPHQIKSFCNIVTETYWVNGPIHITEKIDKCFSAGQPFILVSGVGYLKKLKEFGFKTFNRWWDESYDDEYDYEHRMQKIKETIHTIGNLSIKECEQMYLEMIPTLIHNQNLGKKFKNKIVNHPYQWPMESRT